jgi:hypothetical protein
MPVPVLRRESCGIPRAQHFFAPVGDEYDLAEENIDKLVLAGMPMTLARPRTRRQPA